ncbi:MAG: hypothetical protein CVU33_15475 [Betaproteobacteria bacterium HGW-Betaproteobacteria-6]|jgi:hypothetical protein|nr:MAG: hypothetical protein CVU33_15475 [Betaproteobacteria bacterium HGW-Betaproteobacteria-6]
MRALFPLGFTALLAMPVYAATTAYDLYLLACDGASDCQRVANVALGPDGQKNEHPTPGLQVRIEQRSVLPEAAVVRMVMTLNPAQLGIAGGTAGPASGGQVNIEVDSAIVSQRYYSPVLVFSSSGKVYQLWGRQVASGTVAKNLAQR